MCAQSRRGRGERILGGLPFLWLLRALRVLCAKKILANMHDADGLQCIGGAIASEKQWKRLQKSEARDWVKHPIAALVGAC